MEIPFQNHPFNFRNALNLILRMVDSGALTHRGSKETYDYVSGANHDFSHFNGDHNLAVIATTLCVIIPFKFYGLGVILFKIIRSIEKKSEFWDKALWWKWEKRQIDYYGLKRF
jgi:hypothetical protein